MAQIVLNIDDAVAPRVVAALCEGTTVSQANAKARLISNIKSIVAAYEYRQQRDVELAKVEAADVAAKAAIAAIKPTLEAGLSIT